MTAGPRPTENHRFTTRDVARLMASKKGQVSERTRLHIFRALHRALEVAMK